MKRFLDIENNIIQFIEDYNLNYKCNFKLKPQSKHQSLEHANNSKKTSVPIWGSHHTLIDNLHPPKESNSKSRRSLSHNSINANVTQMTNVSFNKWALRKCKSESDLIDLLNSRDYCYYVDELTIAEEHQAYDEYDEFEVVLTNEEVENKFAEFGYICTVGIRSVSYLEN